MIARCRWFILIINHFCQTTENVWHFSPPLQRVLLARRARSEQEPALAQMDLSLQDAVHIPLATPATASTLLRIHGRGGILRQQLRSVPKARPKAHYSSHECIGDISDLKPKAQRLCLFRRVCLDTQSGEWLYFRRANVSLPPVLFERRYGSQFDFRHVSANGGTEEFLALNKHVRYKPHVRWSPTVVDGGTPSGVTWSAPLHLLSAPFVPTNLGHLVWEEAFPLLLGMVQLGVYDEQAVVLRTHACNQSAAGEAVSASEARLCAKFVAGFIAPLQGREARAVEDVAALRARLFPRTVCFQRLVAGGHTSTGSIRGCNPTCCNPAHFRLQALAVEAATLRPPLSQASSTCSTRKATRARSPSSVSTGSGCSPSTASSMPRRPRNTCCCSCASRGGAAYTTSTRPSLISARAATASAEG